MAGLATAYRYLGKTVGEILTEVTEGANLIDGKQVWEWADSHKDDLPKMLSCCHKELEMMGVTGVPAPFSFRRAAILFRKAKDYEHEIKICEIYTAACIAWDKATRNPHVLIGGYTKPFEERRLKAIALRDKAALKAGTGKNLPSTSHAVQLEGAGTD